MLLVEQKNVRNPLFGHFPVKTEQTQNKNFSIVPEKKQTYFIIGSALFHSVVALHAP